MFLEFLFEETWLADFYSFFIRLLFVEEVGRDSDDGLSSLGGCSEGSGSWGEDEQKKSLINRFSMEREGWLSLI